MLGGDPLEDDCRAASFGHVDSYLNQRVDYIKTYFQRGFGKTKNTPYKEGFYKEKKPLCRTMETRRFATFPQHFTKFSTAFVALRPCVDDPRL